VDFLRIVIGEDRFEAEGPAVVKQARSPTDAEQGWRVVFAACADVVILAVLKAVLLVTFRAIRGGPWRVLGEGWSELATENVESG
jgi:anti-sigma-K factor RskA